MSTQTQRDIAAENGKPGKTPPQQGPAVIRRIEGNNEADRNIVVRRLLPAFALSGLFHTVFMGLFIGLSVWFGDNTPQAAAALPETIDTVVEENEEDDFDLTNEDLGLDPALEAAVDVEREAIENVESIVDMEEPIGIDAPDNFEMPTQTVAPPGAMTTDLTNMFGNQGQDGNVLSGDSGMGGTYASPGMRGRSGATKNALLKAGGGNTESEAAVARGLAWLAKQQKFASPSIGLWEFDGDKRNERVAATGLGLMPFLAAGQTHKSGDYRKNVAAGIAFLLNDQKPDGSFKSTKNMYAVGIAAMALAEAYGMTRDPVLKRHAQAAMNYCCAVQASDGSWGYTPNKSGDTSIVGWHIQALKSGKISNLIVPDATLNRARSFLESVSSDSGAQYGYRTPGGRPSLNAVGLLCRVYIDKWGPRNPSLAKGVENLLKTPPQKGTFNMYYYYYATQVVHFFGGPDWHQNWNPKMRDWLVKLQEKKPGPDYGSWAKDSSSMGSHTGRLGTTCLCLLTLEVYYRYLPLYKRDTGGLNELEM